MLASIQRFDKNFQKKFLKTFYVDDFNPTVQNVTEALQENKVKIFRS